MGKIAFSQEPEAFVNTKMVGREKFKENNDCSVIAVAILCSVPYEVAHLALEMCGRKHGKGAYITQVLEAIKALGHNVEKVDIRKVIDEQYPTAHRVLKSISTHHPARFPDVWKDGKNYALFSSKHVAAIVDGVTVDWSINRQLQGRNVYRVFKSENV